MEIIKNLGFISLIFNIYWFIIKPIRKNIEILKLEHNFKINALKNYHPEIRKMFSNYFEKQTNLFIKMCENSNCPEEIKIDMFGKKIEVIDENEAIEFIKKINEKVKELDQNPDERQRIERAIKFYKKNTELKETEKQLKELTRKYNYLEYEYLIKNMFPGKSATELLSNDYLLTKDEIIQKIKIILRLDEIKANNLFKKLVEPEEGIFIKLSSKKYIKDLLFDKIKNIKKLNENEVDEVLKRLLDPKSGVIYITHISKYTKDEVIEKIKNILRLNEIEARIAFKKFVDLKNGITIKNFLKDKEIYKYIHNTYYLRYFDA